MVRQIQGKGLVIVGVHTPEFEFEKNSNNIKEAVKRFGLLYPVAIDSNFKTWQNYNNRIWPAHYLIDQDGIVRAFQFGEGSYMKTENEIRALLGLPVLAGEEQTVSHRLITSETYLGFERGNKYTSENNIRPNVVSLYILHADPMADNVGLKGKWLVASQQITAAGENSSLELSFLATRVYLVMESEESRLVTVLLDGKPLEKKYYTSDMNDKGQIHVKEPRKLCGGHEK